MSQFLRTKSLPPDEIGKISFFGHESVDANNFLACNGAEIARATYPALFSKIGTSHGIGDGTTTFNLPDCRGRVPRGKDGGAGVDPDAGARTSVNGGASGDSVGSIQGDEVTAHAHASSVEGGSNRFTAGGGVNGGAFSSQWHTTSNTGGNETRMKNMSMAFYIRYK